MAQSEIVGILEIPSQYLPVVRSLLIERGISYQRTTEDGLPTQVLGLYGFISHVGRVVEPLKKETIPFHFHASTGEQAYGLFTAPHAYQITSLPMGVPKKQVDWEEQEHIHKQQKVLALLDS